MLLLVYLNILVHKDTNTPYTHCLQEYQLKRQNNIRTTFQCEK